MFAARTVAPLAADVPLRDLLRVNVVSNRMAAVASWASRSLHIVRRIILRPPVGAGFYEIFTPCMVLDFPLHGQRVIIIADFGEVSLLPEASVNEGDLVAREFCDGVGRKVRNDRIRVLA